MSVERLSPEPILLKNGLYFIIDRYISSLNIYGHFEETPNIKKIVTSQMLQDKSVEHPDIITTGYKKGFLGCFSTRFLTNDQNGTYYKCQCLKCGIKKVMTPQQMLEHKNICKG